MRRLTNVFRRGWIRPYLSEYQWYRRWHGGRWERHFIDVLHQCVWLDVKPGKEWPGYRQPCSVGEPTVEIYPIRGTK